MYATYYRMGSPHAITGRPHGFSTVSIRSYIKRLATWQALKLLFYSTVYNYYWHLQGFILWTLANNMVYHFVFSPCPSSTVINYHQKSCPYYSNCLSFPSLSAIPHPGSRFQNQQPPNSCSNLKLIQHLHIFRFSGLRWYSCHVW